MRFLAPVVATIIMIAAFPALAQDDDTDTSLDDIPHITIVGTAQAEVTPDIATITLGVTTEKPTAKEQGIAAADISTQSLTLTQTFDEIHDANGRITGQKPRGFAAENIVAIKVRDLAKVGALAESLVQNGANRFDGVAFAVEHPEPVLIKLVGEAVKNARAQAQIAAEASGSHLGRVLLIVRPGEGEPAYRPRVMARMKAAAPSAPVEAGTTTLSNTIEVTWALEAN